MTSASIPDLIRESEARLRLGQSTEALSLAAQATARAPEDPLALNALGLALIHCNRFVEAEAALAAALRINYRQPLAWCNLGNALMSQHRHADAIVALDMALDLAPGFADALNNRAYAWASRKDFRKAIADFNALLAQRPDARSFAVAQIMRANICDWAGREAALARIAAGLDGQDGLVMEALEGLALYDDPGLHLRIARSAARAAADGACPMPPAPKASGRIRLGYLSADFREHPVSHLLAEVIERHDRSRFEVVGFSVGPETSDPLQARMKAAFDEWHSLPAASFDALAHAIRSCGIEIAIDLTGFTEGGRTGALARRPAPVQVNFLGFSGSLGADYVDYILADRVVVPPGSEDYYTEKVARLPWSFLANSTLPLPSAASRTANGLPEDGVVFCAFGAAHKITPAVFSIWISILRRVPRSVLWLRASDQAAENLRLQAQAHEVDPDRLVFAVRTSDQASHLSRLALADIGLDTAPYGAHASAYDALWCGMPIVTCPGQSFASRVAASLLSAADMPELICSDWREYEGRAIELATDPAALASLKDRLAAARLRPAPLFDTALYTHDLERAFEVMSARSRNGLAAQGFDLEPAG